MANKKLLAALLVSTLAVSACAPVLVAGVAGGTTGYASAREGGIGQTFSDVSISTGIHDAWFAYNRDMFDKLYVTVFEGRVLIVGSVQNPDYRESAIRFAWQVKGVRQIINEIRIEPSAGVSGYTKDAWIGARLRTRLLSDGEIESRNYKFETNNGTIYLIGVARDQEELTRAINHARNISYVRDVVSYVRLRSDVRPNEGSSAKIQNAPGDAGGSVSSVSPNASANYSNGSNASSSGNAVGYSSSDVNSGYNSSGGNTGASISSTDLPPVQ